MGWSALCQLVYKEPFPGKSSVVFLPMIDMDPSDMTCIYSTLNFVSKEARRHNSNPVLTFDQPLYWKGRNIIQNEPDDSALKSIVLRLGGFHTEMSFLKKRIQAFKDSFGQNRTAKLWIEYMNMIDLLRQFITAESSGHWLLHLKSLQQMLPYLVASGHNLYVNSAHVYLQDMLELEQTHPNLDAAFKSGLHVVRRSDRYWCGLSTDLVIEQALMRSIKTIGGLTRGRGLAETQRAQWLLSMPHCAEMNQAMQKLADVNYQTSEQHKEMGKARTEHDHKDASTVLEGKESLYTRNKFAKY